MTPMERIEGELSDAQKRIAELEYLLARQAKAARQGMDAAKSVASSELEQAKRLHAECNPQALESERAANAALTERIAELEEQEAALAAHVERMNEAVNALTFGLVHDDKPRWEPSKATEGAFSDVMNATSSAPDLSLARRDLIKQAEGAQMVSEDAKMRIEKANAVYPKFDNSGYRQCIYTASRVAADLRQQAEQC